ncbi:putative mRNA turnover 4-like protein [Gregarina niphandrodes]|uniref:mRNA turnover 4-like protein n=1 Tax=Gregarina niphandrodes TaxID=110365 RepID=A0A023AXF4_GRENI|nr:putative mRNA turnover 4-like protein [Gregarina niphandrodes]EZG43307.1 putative mRNA turnover 4-like protein [Gregarina niphandrodes]|eukprot:XP_011133436.1 putative mRNA turnover 4-like protein [Gregarina niphandrodes]
MARSRKAKVVPLTKVGKKVGMDRKLEIADKIRAAVAQNRFTYVVEMSHFKTEQIQRVRESLKPGTMFMARSRIMQVALGVTAATSAAENIYKLSGLIEGRDPCVVCCGKSPEELSSLFLGERMDTYAKAGDVVEETVVIPEGKDSLSQFQFNMEPLFRKLGVPTVLDNGTIVVLTDFVICAAGETLDSNKARLLKLLDYKLAKSQCKLKGYYDNENRTVKIC